MSETNERDEVLNEIAALAARLDHMLSALAELAARVPAGHEDAEFKQAVRRIRWHLRHESYVGAVWVVDFERLFVRIDDWELSEFDVDG